MVRERGDRRVRGGFGPLVHRAYRLLISPRVTFWLLTAWALLYAVWVVPFTVAGQAEETVEAIALEWLPLRILYAAVAIALLACTASRAARDWRRCAATSVPQLRSDGEESWYHLALSLDEAETRLRKARFEVVRAEHGVRGIRGRYRPLWGSAFHLGILLFTAALALNGATLTTGGIELIEGQSAEEFFAATPERTGSEAIRGKLESFTLQEITPRFFEQFLLFERLDATAEYRGAERSFSLARPLWLDPVSYVSIQDFNYAPRVTVTSAQGDLMDDVVQSMKLFPPGSEDTLGIPAAKIALVLQVFPDYEVRDGVEISRSYNTADPRVRVTVFERVGGVTTQRVLARRTVELGDPIVLPDGSRVVVSELRTVGTFRFVTAPWMPLVVLTGLLLLAAVAGRLLVPRLDVVLWSDGDGVLMDARLDTLGRRNGAAQARRVLENGGGRAS